MKPEKNYRNGVLHGKCVRYTNDTGQWRKKIITMYKNGIKHGDQIITLNSTGRVIKVQHYIEGKLIYECDEEGVVDIHERVGSKVMTTRTSLVRYSTWFSHNTVVCINSNYIRHKYMDVDYEQPKPTINYAEYGRHGKKTEISYYENWITLLINNNNDISICVDKYGFKTS